MQIFPPLSPHSHLRVWPRYVGSGTGITIAQKLDTAVQPDMPSPDQLHALIMRYQCLPDVLCWRYFDSPSEKREISSS
jgi:hypothetical protein